jgi:hypothetical protein
MTKPSPPRAGELRFITAGTTRALVLVLATYPTHLVFALAHPYTEYATSKDVLLPALTTGLRYDIVVCCDLVGTALLEQADQARLGTAPEEVLLAARRFSPSDLPESSSWWVGTRCLGALDARWDHKAALRELAAALSASSLALLLD